MVRVAVIDGVGQTATVGLSWRDSDGEWVQDIDWPAAWPEFVTPAFLRAQEYTVVIA